MLLLLHEGNAINEVLKKTLYALRKDVKRVGWDTLQQWRFVMQKVMFKIIIIIIIKNYFDKPTRYPYGTYVIADYNCNS